MTVRLIGWKGLKSFFKVIHKKERDDVEGSLGIRYFIVQVEAGRIGAGI